VLNTSLTLLQKLACWLLLLLLSSANAAVSQDRIPSQAYQYRKILHAEIERTWGLRIPADAIAASAGTIHQESGWNPLAQSPYAKGLTQFTDSTWADMARRDATIQNLGDVWNPHAAIRAMVTYHHSLWSLFPYAQDDNNRWAFVLASYNGGAGWIFRDIKLCALPVCNPSVWWGNVERNNAGRAPAMFQENRGYPFRILKRWLPLYSSF